MLACTAATGFFSSFSSFPRDIVKAGRNSQYVQQLSTIVQSTHETLQRAWAEVALAIPNIHPLPLALCSNTPYIKSSPNNNLQPTNATGSMLAATEISTNFHFRYTDSAFNRLHTEHRNGRKQNTSFWTMQCKVLPCWSAKQKVDSMRAMIKEGPLWTSL